MTSNFIFLECDNLDFRGTDQSGRSLLENVNIRLKDGLNDFDFQQLGINYVVLTGYFNAVQAHQLTKYYIETEIGIDPISEKLKLQYGASLWLEVYRMVLPYRATVHGSCDLSNGQTMVKLGSLQCF
jgi:hypothetical protein